MYKFILALLVVGLLSACDDKGPMEKSGEKMDNTVEEMQGGGKDFGDKVKDTGDEFADKIDDAATEAGNKIEDACEETKEKAGADDTDC